MRGLLLRGAARESAGRWGADGAPSAHGRNLEPPGSERGLFPLPEEVPEATAGMPTGTALPGGSPSHRAHCCPAEGQRAGTGRLWSSSWGRCRVPTQRPPHPPRAPQQVRTGRGAGGGTHVSTQRGATLRSGLQWTLGPGRMLCCAVNPLAQFPSFPAARPPTRDTCGLCSRQPRPEWEQERAMGATTLRASGPHTCSGQLQGQPACPRPSSARPMQWSGQAS